MKQILIYVPMLLIFLFTACDDSTVKSELDCSKLESREDANNLMSDEADRRFKDSSKIMANLIGEWGLIGVLPGWTGFESGKECIRLKITANSIEIEDQDSGISTSTDWELNLIKVNGYTGFYLSSNEDVWTNRIGMEVFSENIMYGSGRVDDGDIYIYEKL